MAERGDSGARMSSRRWRHRSQRWALTAAGFVDVSAMLRSNRPGQDREAVAGDWQAVSKDLSQALARAETEAARR